MITSQWWERTFATRHCQFQPESRVRRGTSNVLGEAYTLGDEWVCGFGERV